MGQWLPGGWWLSVLGFATGRWRLEIPQGLPAPHLEDAVSAAQALKLSQFRCPDSM